MRQDELAKLIAVPAPAGAAFEVTAVSEDSRRAVPGTLFAAMAGEHADGHDYAEAAVAAGATAVMGDRLGVESLHGVPYVYHPSPRKAAGLVAHALAGDPTRDMTVIGITGTNGKSSAAFLSQAILRHAGRPTANFGTVGYEIAGETAPARHTTPFAEELAPLFARARAAGETTVVMEVSSHALAQDRVAGIAFRVAAFMNLTQDHLDYHGNMDDYRRAKLRLFGLVCGDGAFTVVNQEDPAAMDFVAASPGVCYRFGGKGECVGRGLQMALDGSRFELETPWGSAAVSLRMAGAHNVSNALCAAAICGGLGVAPDTIADGLASLASVPGRFEAIDAGQDFHVIVDYAHTDDGLRNVLEAARAVCRGRIITVFGCGGDRDKGKRPKMGAVGARLSDFAVLTSDNPRTEDPHRILLDIEVGVQREGKKKGDDYLVIEARAEAIRQAISKARPGDLVLIAGKGHEDYQILGTERIHFDDREVARAALGEG